ncbi:MAG: ArnT family glycosyltransferase [Maricaulaceae bacterium]
MAGPAVRQGWAWGLGLRTAVGFAAVITLWRALLVAFTPLELYPDEAQYWTWAQSLDWGYVSKPPLIAGLIAVVTAVLGDATWAIRAPGPILHFATAVLLGLCGRALGAPRAGAWACAIYVSAPGVWIGGMVLSTATVMTPLAALALLALARLRDDPRSWGWAVSLGVAFGLGFLAKYAMVYAAIGLSLGLALDAKLRRSLLRAQGALALVIAMALIAPNVLWNLQTGFATVSHTAENANWADARFDVRELGGFLIDQFYFVGPAALVIAGLGAARALAGPDRDRWAWLVAFAAPPLAIVAIQAFISRAHANWAAAALPAAFLLAGYWLAQRPRPAWLSGLVFAPPLMIAAVWSAVVLSPGFIDAMGWSNVSKRVRGWEATTQALAQRCARIGCATVVTDDRFVFYAAHYYAPEIADKLVMWSQYARPRNHAELIAPLTRGAEGPLLVAVSKSHHAAIAAPDFAERAALAPLQIGLGGDKVRSVTLWRASAYAPQLRTPSTLD